MTNEEEKYFYRKIISKIDEIVQNLLGDDKLILDKEMGENSVCIVCDISEKVCEKIPDYRCHDALKGNTELDELEKALQRLHDGNYGICTVCGNEIPKKELDKNLTLTICNNCSSNKKHQK